jgi:cytochrome c
MIRNHEQISLGFALAAAIAALALLPFHVEGQSAPDGQALFNRRCGGCHSLESDNEGPRLKGVVGRMAGTVKTFQYSEPLQKAKFKWDELKLDQWLTDTESVVPDNDMSFRVPKKEERAAIIAYLKSLSPR